MEKCVMKMRKLRQCFETFKQINKHRMKKSSIQQSISRYLKRPNIKLNNIETEIIK